MRPQASWIAVLALAALSLANAWLFASWRGAFPFGKNELAAAKAESESVARHYEAAAAPSGLMGSPAFANGIARLRVESLAARSAEDVRASTQRWGAYLGSLIGESRNGVALSRIIEILRADPALRSAKAGVIAVLPGAEAGRIEIADPNGILPPSARATLERDRVAAGLTHRLELEIARGVVQPASADALAARLKAVEGEKAGLVAQLREADVQAGWTEFEGLGVVVKVHDAKGKGDESLVHDADIRSVVNELYASGAKGIEVGGVRLRRGSFIRCVGPVLQVDGRPVAVGPVMIKAVGDPEVLSRALEILRRALSEYNLKMTIEKKWVWISAAQKG